MQLPKRCIFLSIADLEDISLFAFKKYDKKVNKDYYFLSLMEEYYFLFALALIYTIVATIRDLKTTEVPNWLNFSFLTFALAYRAFYAIFTRNTEFFFFGLIGAMLFFIIANLFYYGKVFAGGDAKLLIGFGAVLPFESLSDFFSLTVIFIFILTNQNAGNGLNIVAISLSHPLLDMPEYWRYCAELM